MNEIKGFIQTRILPQLRDENVIAILLVGSFYNNSHHKYSDIDLMIIGSNYTLPIENKKLQEEKMEFDIWFYDYNFIKETLESPQSSYQTISLQSLMLSFLQNHQVLFEREEFTTLKLLAMNWIWNHKAKEVLNYKLVLPKVELFQQAFQENVILLRILQQKLEKNLLISHRMKDNQEFFSLVGDEEIGELLHEVMEFYNSLNLGRMWTELKDAERAIKLQKWTLGLASLRDVTKFLIRIVLNINDIDLLDPMFWSMIDSNKLPSALITIVSKLYNQYPLILKLTN